VLAKDGQPALALVTVFLGTDSKHLDDGDAARVSDGRYSFKAIRPGKYRLFAIDVLELLPAIGGGKNGEAMQQFFDAAEEIVIKEGDRISRDIPAWTRMPEKKEAHAPPR